MSERMVRQEQIAGESVPQISSDITEIAHIIPHELVDSGATDLRENLGSRADHTTGGRGADRGAPRQMWKHPCASEPRGNHACCAEHTTGTSIPDSEYPCAQAIPREWIVDVPVHQLQDHMEVVKATLRERVVHVPARERQEEIVNVAPPGSLGGDPVCASR